MIITFYVRRCIYDGRNNEIGVMCVNRQLLMIYLFRKIDSD